MLVDNVVFLQALMVTQLVVLCTKAKHTVCIVYNMIYHMNVAAGYHTRSCASHPQ